MCLMSEAKNQPGCFDFIRLALAAGIIIPILDYVYESVLESRLFEDPQVQSIYEEWPGLLDVVARLGRERMADAAIVISAGFIGAIFYSIFRRIPGLFLKTIVLAIVVLACMWPIGWLISDSILSGTVLLADTLRFRFWNSVTMSFLGGLASIWMFDYFLEQWTKWWDSLVDRVFRGP